MINGWDYGVKLTYSDSDSYGFVSHCLCKECADIIVPIYRKAYEEANAKIHSIQEQSQEKHIDLKVEDIIDAIMEAI